MPEMSLNEYRKHRGVTLHSVQVAIKDKRIDILRTEVHGKNTWVFVDSDACDAKWIENSKLPQRLTRGEMGKGPPADPQQQAVPPENNGYLQSRAQREKIAVLQADLEYKKASGQLVEASKIKIAWANVAQNMQQNMMSVPSRLSALVAGEIRAQGTMLVEKFDAGTMVTRVDLVKWLDCLCDEKVVRDLMMSEIKKILQVFADAKR